MTKKSTQTEVAQFCTTTPKTLQNGTTPQIQEEAKSLRPFGKHNLSKGTYSFCENLHIFLIFYDFLLIFIAIFVIIMA